MNSECTYFFNEVPQFRDANVGSYPEESDSDEAWLFDTVKGAPHQVEENKAPLPKMNETQNDEEPLEMETVRVKSDISQHEAIINIVFEQPQIPEPIKGQIKSEVKDDTPSAAPHDVEQPNYEVPQPPGEISAHRKPSLSSDGSSHSLKPEDLQLTYQNGSKQGPRRVSIASSSSSAYSLQDNDDTVPLSDLMEVQASREYVEDKSVENNSLQYARNLATPISKRHVSKPSLSSNMSSGSSGSANSYTIYGPNSKFRPPRIDKIGWNRDVLSDELDALLENGIAWIDQLAEAVIKFGH